MKVFNLRCNALHTFEGWFGSEDDFLEQKGRGLVTCPVCNNATVEKMPSAPRLNLGHATAPALDERNDHTNLVPSGDKHSVSDERSLGGTAEADQQAQWVQMARHLLATTEDVGDRFANEARKMHWGEAPERPIRGQTTTDEKQALREEGISVVEVTLPAFLKETLQ